MITLRPVIVPVSYISFTFSYLAYEGGQQSILAREDEPTAAT